jgi:hypothetical protein
MSQQSLRQQSVRDITGTAYTYEGDFHALFDIFEVAAGPFNQRLLAYINIRLGTAYTEINGAMAALADDAGADNFQSMGTFIAGETITLTATSIAENAANGTAIGTLAVVGGNGVYTFTVTSDPDNVFTIDTDDLDKDGTLDYETATSHQVTIEADNGVDPPISRTFTIYVTDVDDTAPTILNFSPADGATGVSRTGNLVATFDEPIAFGTGNITIKKTSDDTTVEAFDVATEVGTGNGQVSISGAVLTINPTSTLTENLGLYVVIDATAIDDLAGNSFAGIAAKTTWNFTTIDDVAPTVSSYSPADNATDVAINATLTATFNETVTLGASGVITLKKTSDNSTIEAWDVATESGSTAGKVEVLTNTALTMHLTTDLANSIEYYVIWDAGVVKDASNNNVAALSSTTTWSFTTVAAGGSYETESDAIFAVMTGLDDTRKGIIDDLVAALKAGSVWSKLDVFYVFAAHNAGASLVNWKNPGTFDATLTNAPTFATDRGYTGDGSTNYIDTNYAPATNGVQYTQNSCHLSVWDRTANAQSATAIIAFNSSTGHFYVRYTDNNCYLRLQHGGGTIANLNSDGHLVGTRTDIDNVALYRNGSSVNTVASGTTGAIPAGTVKVLGGAGVGFNNHQVAAASAGANVSTVAAAFHTALAAYMTAVGA